MGDKASEANEWTGSLASRTGVPTSLETRAAIMDLYADYSWTFDTGDDVGCGELFTEDGEYVAKETTFKGRDGIAGAVRWVREEPSRRGFQHWAHNFRFRGDGETCFVRAQGIGPRALDGMKFDLSFVGWYDDTFRKVDGAWYFARRIWRYGVPDGHVPENDPSDLLLLQAQNPDALSKGIGEL